MPFCHSCSGVIWSMPAGPFGSATYSSINDSIRSLVFILMLLWTFLDPLHCLWALLSHFFLLEHPWPICFPWVFSAHFLSLHTHRLLLTLLGFPDPITLFFILRAHGFSINPLLSYLITLGLLRPILTFLHHIMPMSLLSLSGGSFRPVYFPQGPLIYFIGLWTIVPTIQLNSFSNHPLILLRLYCWVSSYYWASKIGINTKDDRHY